MLHNKRKKEKKGKNGGHLLSPVKGVYQTESKSKKRMMKIDILTLYF